MATVDLTGWLGRPPWYLSWSSGAYVRPDHPYPLPGGRRQRFRHLFEENVLLRRDRMDDVRSVIMPTILSPSTTTSLLTFFPSISVIASQIVAF